MALAADVNHISFLGMLDCHPNSFTAVHYQGVATPTVVTTLGEGGEQGEALGANSRFDVGHDSVRDLASGIV